MNEQSLLDAVRTFCAAEHPRLVSFYGDSVTAGSFSASLADTQRSYLAPRPVARTIYQLGPTWAGIDHGVPGWDITQHAQGWESTVAADPAGIVVLRFGGGDALTGTPVADFEAHLDSMVDLALYHGKAVVLVGVIRLVRKPDWQDPIGVTEEVLALKESRAVDMDAAVRRVAAHVEVPFVDIRALPFYGAQDIADYVHPAQDYANRCADAIAATIAQQA